ncbi:MAG: hypothetical protein HN337_07040 [Deltaproteobacteria bacterium]|jgi:hypothetical protein|nr:hypothetical protein [Deltaproteobacteria bacterium]
MKPIAIVKKNRSVGRWLDIAGWILFVSWALINFLFKPFPEGIATLGIGAIVLGVAVGRFIFGGSISNFWLLIGIFFVTAGVGYLMQIDLPFLAMALIACGILMLTHSWATKH